MVCVIDFTLAYNHGRRWLPSVSRMYILETTATMIVHCSSHCLQDVHSGNHGDRDGQSEIILVTTAYNHVRQCTPLCADCLQDVHSGNHGDRDGQSENIPGDHGHHGVHDCTPMYTVCLQSKNIPGDHGDHGDHGDRDGQSKIILVTMVTMIVRRCIPIVSKVKYYSGDKQMHMVCKLPNQDIIVQC